MKAMVEARRKRLDLRDDTMQAPKRKTGVS
jgi:hypothetical protein